MNFDWTETDLETAEAFKTARLKLFVPLLAASELHLDSDCILHIKATDRQHLEALRLFLPELLELIFIVSGCYSVAVWLDQSLLSLLTHKEFDLESENRNDNDEGFSMASATATAEKQTTTQTATPYSSPQALQGQVLATIAAKVHQPIESVRAWIQEQGAEIIPLGKEEVISGSVAVQTLNHFFEVLRQQEMANLGLLQNGFTMPEPEPETTATPQPETTATNGNGKTAAKSTPKTRMQLPRTFSKNIVKSVSVNLDRALPKDSRVRAIYLNQIVDESEEGLAFLNSAAGLIVAKNGGDKAKVAASLLASAKKLAKTA